MTLQELLGLNKPEMLLRAGEIKKAPLGLSAEKENFFENIKDTVPEVMEDIATFKLGNCMHLFNDKKVQNKIEAVIRQGVFRLQAKDGDGFRPLPFYVYQGKFYSEKELSEVIGCFGLAEVVYHPSGQKSYERSKNVRFDMEDLFYYENNVMGKEPSYDVEAEVENTRD